MKFLLLLCCSLLAAADAPRIVYSKSFPGSSPAYVKVTLERDGQFAYREAPEDPNPQTGKLTKPEVDAIFGLADKLDHFQRPLESNLKVAKMGIKSFRYEGVGKPAEVNFNYSLDADARTLADWFEKVVETNQHYAALDSAMHFDKLGVDKALLQLETAFDRQRVVGATVLLPLLDRIANNRTFLDRARDRSARLAAGIRQAEEVKP